LDTISELIGAHRETKVEGKDYQLCEMILKKIHALQQMSISEEQVELWTEAFGIVQDEP
jgi:hypothetical protein